MQPSQLCAWILRRAKSPYPEAKHPPKRNNPNMAPATQPPQYKRQLRAQFFLNSFPSFFNSFLFAMTVDYTEEDLRKAADEAVKTKKLRPVARRWHILPFTLYKRLNGALPRSVAYQDY